MTYNTASGKTMDGTPHAKHERFTQLGRTCQLLSRGYSELDIILAQAELIESQEQEDREIKRAQGMEMWKIACKEVLLLRPWWEQPLSLGFMV